MKRPVTWFDYFNYVLLVLITIACVYPFYYIFIYSLSTPMEAIKGITLVPKGFTIVNYVEIFKLDNMFNAFIVSVSRTVIGTLVTIFCSALFAYCVTKKELYFRRTMYRLMVVSMYFSAGLIPWYLTMKQYGLRNSFLLYILPMAVTAYYVVLLKTYIEQLPQGLEESAMIDGAGYFRIFTMIVMPLSLPILATIAVFSAVAQWNTFFDNYFLVTTDKLQTLQLILYTYLTKAQQVVQSSNMEDLNRGEAAKINVDSVRITITMVVTIPVLLVYPFLQRYFVKGIMLGAVKG